MSRRDKRIEVEITGETRGLRKAVNDATGLVHGFNRDLKKSFNTVGGQGFTLASRGFTAIGVAAAAAAAGGIYLFTTQLSQAVTKAVDFEKASFGLEMALEAANRQFNIGSASDWEKNIAELQQTLRVFSETDLRNASARTIDMTKRLGLSADQMKKVVQVSGDLSAGKTTIVDGVERVTAALRGEAEASEYLGLTLNENYVRAWHEANNATGKAWKYLSDLEKAQIRYNILLEQAGPSLGKAAKSMGLYSGAVQDTSNDFGDLQIEAGKLITQNSFIIDTVALAGDMFNEWTEYIKANRGEMVSLVKDGVLLLIDGVGAAIEIVGRYVESWGWAKIAAYGAILATAKGLEFIALGFRTALTPLDLLLTGLEKIHVIDVNPLKDFQETMGGFGDYMVDDWKRFSTDINQTNDKFDDAKELVESFRERIAEIPAEYKDTTQAVEESNETIEMTVVKVGDTWKQVYSTAKSESKAATSEMLADIEKVKKAASSVGIGGSGKKSYDGYATGGNPFHGALSGYGGGDRRLIMVEDGEHVIRKEAVSKLGHGFFQKFNRLTFPSLPAFAIGGGIGSAAVSSAGASSTSSPTYSLTVNLPAGASSANANSIAKQVMSELQKMHRRSS